MVDMIRGSDAARGILESGGFVLDEVLAQAGYSLKVMSRRSDTKSLRQGHSSCSNSKRPPDNILALDRPHLDSD